MPSDTRACATTERQVRACLGLPVRLARAVGRSRASARFALTARRYRSLVPFALIVRLLRHHTSARFALTARRYRSPLQFAKYAGDGVFVNMPRAFECCFFQIEIKMFVNG